MDTQRFTLWHSVKDVIRILENEPVKGDMVPEITAVQVMNRVAIAHLSIERALKSLIGKAGGSAERGHDLGRQFRGLLRHDPASATFLGEVFEAAVCHYRYNPNAGNMKHLRTLETYLETVGSDRAFQDIRYWELGQSLDEVLLGRIYLSLHIELLYGVSQILLAPNQPMNVVGRVERAVEGKMWRTAEVAYSPGTPKEHSVRAYMEWRQGFRTWAEALACAVQQDFNVGDDFMADLTRKAYMALLEVPDSAVRYFASTLDVLPRQSRGVIPCVEWLGPEKERSGCVKTTAGEVLGFIDRGLDGLWYITPLRDGAVTVSAKAASQTDARCYLATLLSRLAKVTLNADCRLLRIVGTKHDFFQGIYGEAHWLGEPLGEERTSTYKVTLWEESHEIGVDDSIRIEVPDGSEDGLMAVDILEGRVTEVDGQIIYVLGSTFLAIEKVKQ